MYEAEVQRDSRPNLHPMLLHQTLALLPSCDCICLPYSHLLSGWLRRTHRFGSWDFPNPLHGPVYSLGYSSALTEVSELASWSHPACGHKSWKEESRWWGRKYTHMDVCVHECAQTQSVGVSEGSCFSKSEVRGWDRRDRMPVETNKVTNVEQHQIKGLSLSPWLCQITSSMSKDIPTSRKITKKAGTVWRFPWNCYPRLEYNSFSLLLFLLSPCGCHVVSESCFLTFFFLWEPRGSEYYWRLH